MFNSKDARTDEFEGEVNMSEVWLVRVVYRYDGYDNTEVYNTKEKACDTADQLVFKFKESGYKNGDGFDDIVFAEDMDDDMDYIILEDKFGEVEITVEKKIVK